MQSGRDLLSALYQRGVTIWTENGQLRFQAPRGALAPEKIEELHRLKAEIVTLLEQAQASIESPIRPRADSDPVPLTGAQLALWKYSGEQRLSDHYCVTSVRILGTLDISLLRSSTDAVVQRHESLRTRIQMHNGLPTQHVDRVPGWRFEELDLSKQPAITADDEVKRLAQELVSETTDVSVGPMVKARLIRISKDEHVLISTFNHMISDGISKHIVGRETWTLYRQAEQGLPPSLPQPPLQYPDYAVWQQHTFDTYPATHRAYWKARLGNAPSVHLPPDGHPADVKTPSAGILDFPFGKTLSNSLRGLAGRERSLLSLLVLAVYAAVMARWCRQQDILIVFVSNGRYRRELENMTGLLSTYLYLRMEIRNNDTFLDLLKQVSLEFYAANDHRDFDRMPSFIPNCKTELCFNWLPAYSEWWQMDQQCGPQGKVRLQPFQFVARLTAKFIAYFSETNEGITFTVQYRRDSFSDLTMRRLGDDVRRFAEVVSQRPLATLASISGSGF